MFCPNCNKKMKVLETRQSGDDVERVRVCPQGHKFRTFEKIAHQISKKKRFRFLAKYRGKR